MNYWVYIALFTFMARPVLSQEVSVAKQSFEFNNPSTHEQKSFSVGMKVRIFTTNVAKASVGKILAISDSTITLGRSAHRPTQIIPRENIRLVYEVKKTLPVILGSAFTFAGIIMILNGNEVANETGSSKGVSHRQTGETEELLGVLLLGMGIALFVF